MASSDPKLRARNRGPEASSTPPSSRERKAARPPARKSRSLAAEAARARCADQPTELLRRGIEEFNRGEFFEQHETLEMLWRATDAPVRDLYRGILQVGVGLHHLRRGNFHGACVLLEEGVRRLAPFAPECQSVDVDALLRDARTIQGRLLELGASRIGDFDWSLAPRVQFRERKKSGGSMTRRSWSAP